MTITPGFCLLWALCLLVLPFGWSMGALLAAFIHEIAHCVAVLLCGGHIQAVKLGGQGAVIEASPMTPGKEAVCALAGPLGSFSVMLIGERFPEAAICALIQGAYNLMPFFPLDGGRLLRCLFSECICCAVEAFSLVILAGLTLLVGIQDREMVAIILLFVWFPLIRGKIACKETKLAVQ